jgi:hypothetical protein
MEFYAKRAWPEDKELAQSLTLAELIALSEKEPIILPSWCTEEIKEQESVERETPEGSPLLEEPKEKPD